MTNRKILASVLVILLLLTSCSCKEQETTATVSSTSRLEIHYLDVGHADAALIICDGMAMMIDGGNAEDSSLIYAYLESKGISHLNYMICTHPHEDHVGGLIGALHYATVDTVYCSAETADTHVFTKFSDHLAAMEKEISVPSHGDTFLLGGAVVTFLGPISPAEDINNMSLVLRIEHGSNSFLFTGDAGHDEEAQILDAGYDVSCDVLKVGHHGIHDSSSSKWLWEVRPDYAVISVGADNDGGFPSDSVLYALEKLNSQVFRTDLQGNIICISDGQNISFSTEKEFSSDPVLNEINPATIPPAVDSITFICNTSSFIFHDPLCPSVEEMAKKNSLEVTLTQEELIAMGYSPCGYCSP